MTEKESILRAEAPVKESFRKGGADAYYCALRMRLQYISCTNSNVDTVLHWISPVFPHAFTGKITMQAAAAKSQTKSIDYLEIWP